MSPNRQNSSCRIGEEVKNGRYRRPFRSLNQSFMAKSSNLNFTQGSTLGLKSENQIDNFVLNEDLSRIRLFDLSERFTNG